MPAWPQLEHEQGQQRRRQERLMAVQRRGGPWLLQLLRRGWLRAGELATDHTRSVLILSVFAFKVRLCKEAQDFFAASFEHELSW